MLLMFYFLVNGIYRLLLKDRYMLHAPLYKHPNDSLYDAQARFADHCLRALPAFKDLSVLEVGCGNGAFSMYLVDRYQPASLIAVDIDGSQIARAKNSAKSALCRIDFRVDDAQKLSTVLALSQDVVVCVESALHYPMKEAFLRQAHRVLKPGGTLLLGDILRSSTKKSVLPLGWVSVFSWSYDQYLSAFDATGFRVMAAENMSALVSSSPGFKERIFPGVQQTLAQRLATAAGRRLLTFYRRLFKNRFRYQLWVLQT